LANIFNRSTLQVTKLTVKRLSDEVVVVHARMTLAGHTPVGDINEPKSRSNIFSFVVR